MPDRPLVAVDAPLPRRVFAWMDERFPPVVYTLLVGVFGLACASVGWASGGASWGLVGLPVVWLFFLHLRVFDEHKDFDKDVVAYPQRALSRGVVTLPLLARIGVAAVGLQIGLSALLGLPALLAWAASFAFSVGMRFEFGVGRWLNDHIVLYALSHNPVMAGLTAIVVLGTGAPIGAPLAAMAVLSCLGMLAFEFGRKTRLPEEEHPGVPSYTTELGQGPARALLLATHVATGVAAAVTLASVGRGLALAGAVGALTAAPGVVTAIGRKKAKYVELGASAVLLIGLGAVALLARGGVS